MSNELILSLGWTLLHSLWQIGLLGLCTLGLERLFRQYSAQVRHQLLLFMLGGMVLVCAFTLFQEWRHFTQIQHLAPNFGQGAAAVNPSVLNSPHNPGVEPAPVPVLLKVKIWVENHLLWLVALWLLGMAYFSVRFSWNYRALHQLRRQSLSLNDAQLLSIIHPIQQSLGLLQKIHFYVHPSLPSPLTFGYFRPVILLPAALLCQTPPDLLEALLRHELIHIRRADFLINLALSVIQILFFYHPLIWMLTHRIQELREEACDADVLDSGCNNLTYAEALLHLQKLNHHQNIPLVMQAQNQPSHFAHRVKQILRRANPATSSRLLVPKSWLSAGLGLLLAIILSIGAFATPKKQVASSIPSSTVQEFALDARKTEVQTINLPAPPTKLKPKAKKQEAQLLLPAPTLVDTPPKLKIETMRDKILFLGENEISVSVSGVLAEQIKLSSSGVLIESLGNGQFKAYARQIGKMVIRVNTPDYYWDVEFLVILPDPVATLDNFTSIGGEIPISSFRESKGVDPKLPPLSSDYNAVKCEILGFNCIYIPREKDPIQVSNPGGLFIPKALNLVQTVNVNDQIIFDNIRAKCPGDETGRKINNMAFKIVADPEKKE